MRVCTSANAWRCVQVAEEIWVVEKKGVTKWRGGIDAYKEHLRATHAVSVGVLALLDAP